MPCKHKFSDSKDFKELLPLWKCKTLIIGTFNPENAYHENNTANFFYQRRKNYFWDVLPLLSGKRAIEKSDTEAQIEYLKSHSIGITDILLCINDAELTNQKHISLISTVNDDDIESFHQLKWNTENIIEFIGEKNIEAVFFTKLGKLTQINPEGNTFEFQMRLIESFCSDNNIYCSRLHSPTGMGLGKGPRIETLFNRWVNENGANLAFFRNNIV
jgi:hypothetical protein